MSNYTIRKYSIVLLLLLTANLLNSCKKELNKYDRPEWLKGKVYTQMLDMPELSTFCRCLELTGYDEVINTSGSYTVFAPSNEAFDAFLSANPNYSSIEDIPLPELNRIVKYHVVQDPWTKSQLKKLDIYGWIDTMDIKNNVARGFKRETLFKENDRKYGIKWEYGKGTVITDTLEADLVRRVATDSRKYAPIFYSEYFTVNDIPSSDYQFYFDRPFDQEDDLYFAGAKVTSDENFAENGFVYIIDEVITPLRNGYEILGDKTGDDSYSNFLALIDEFPKFSFNQEKTNQQEGVDQGLEVDSLFDLTFPDLVFDLTSELTKPPAGSYGLPSNVTVRYHHGLVAPTDQAMDDFINEYFKVPGGWGSLEAAPGNIRRIIANTHMSQYEIFPTSFKDGFLNGERDIVTLNSSDIVHKEFGSNCTFIGVNKAIVPRAFSSVTGPIYLRPGYSKIMNAIEQTGILPLLKKPNNNFSFFVESDFNSSRDSSLVFEELYGKFYAFLLSDYGEAVQTRYTRSSLRNLILNHVCNTQPDRLARKEFIPNLAGTHLIFNNETGEVSGTAPTTAGYGGSEPVQANPQVLSTGDNGKTYDIPNWFSFSGLNMFAQISNHFPKFHALLKKAGLTLDKLEKYSFINETDYYTVFVPSDAAIDAANLDSIPVQELAQVLKLHFVQGELIFTDGKITPGLYETMRIDESSTQYTTVYTKININPGIDNIQVIGKNNSVYATVNESENTNIIGSTVEPPEGDAEEIYPNTLDNAVIHEISKVLSADEVGQ
ncbi:MAG TPA: fasciclin domain-containing protein [Bacteroidales bacterium]|nr:fasciclin domain-containing protein [Bacteroidales bacterium]